MLHLASDRMFQCLSSGAFHYKDTILVLHNDFFFFFFSPEVTFGIAGGDLNLLSLGITLK